MTCRRSFRSQLLDGADDREGGMRALLGVAAVALLGLVCGACSTPASITAPPATPTTTPTDVTTTTAPVTTTTAPGHSFQLTYFFPDYDSAPTIYGTCTSASDQFGFNPTVQVLGPDQQVIATITLSTTGMVLYANDSFTAYGISTQYACAFQGSADFPLVATYTFEHGDQTQTFTLGEVSANWGFRLNSDK
jgi:hypothetical protein